MTDLCYNCGDCHLPKPCPQELKLCAICGNHGHSYNFCPLSVRLIEPNYQFWALCHNCDSWHLPDPCQSPLHKCAQCGQKGHKEFFCPTEAVSRHPPPELDLTNNSAKTSVKRQRTTGSAVGETSDKRDVKNLLTPEHIRFIKLETARLALHYRDLGYSNEQTLQHIMHAPEQDSHIYSPTPINPGTLPFKVRIPHANASSITGGHHQPATPSAAIDYASQHQRFSSGELAQSMSFSYQNPFTANTSSFTQTVDTLVPHKNATHAQDASNGREVSKNHRDHGEGVAVNGTASNEPVNSTTAPIAGTNPDPSTQVHQHGQNWNPLLLDTADVTAVTGEERQDSAVGSAVSHSNQIEKNSLAHVLNATQASTNQPGSQTLPAPKKYFTYTPMQNTFPLNTPGSSNTELLPAFGDTQGRKVTAAQQPQPAIEPAETEGYVIVPHAGERTPEGSLEEPGKVTAPEETKTVEKPKKGKGRGRPKQKS